MSNRTAIRIDLGRPGPSVLGTGAYLKNAACLIHGPEAWISVDHGSLDHRESLLAFEQTMESYVQASGGSPRCVVHDLHPDFYATRWALQSGFPTRGIQHHHAHVTAVMAEHQVKTPVLGLALDGFGLGSDGGAWGGELLEVTAAGFTRLGHLFPLPQPGGDLAARQPWRMGAGALHTLGRDDLIETTYGQHPGAAQTAHLLRQNKVPLHTTSMGRLFDAACGLLDILPIARFEGEAPMRLESLVTGPLCDPSGWNLSAEGLLDLRPLLSRLIGCEHQEGANLFHGTLIAAILEWVDQAVQKTGHTTIIFSGGCFFNKVLREGLFQEMIKRGLMPLLPQKLSVGDQALALGQAYAVMLQEEGMP